MNEILARTLAIEAWTAGTGHKVALKVNGEPVAATRDSLAAATKLIHGTSLSAVERTSMVQIGALLPRELSVPQHAQLASGVRLKIHLGAALEPVDGDTRAVQPTHLEYSLFLSAHQAFHLERLRADVLSWWAAAMLGEPGEAIGDGVAGWLAAIHARDLELQSVLDLQGSGLESQLVPTAPLSEDSDAFPPVRLEIRGTGMPLRVPLAGWEGTRQLARQLPALAFSHVSSVPGPLAHCVRVPAVPMQMKDGQVRDLGLGALIVGVGEKRVWVDPWLNPAVAPGELGPPDALVLTAARIACCPTEMMLLLPKDIPVLLPAEEGGLPNRMATLLRMFGFGDVRIVQAGDRLALWQGGVVFERPGQWRIESNARSLRVCSSAPHPEASKVDVVFADLRHDRRPALFRHPGLILDPVGRWLHTLPPFDWSVLAAQVRRAGESNIVLVDSGARYHAVKSARFRIDEPAGCRRFGPYAHWDERPDKLRVTVSAPGMVHDG